METAFVFIRITDPDGQQLAREISEIPGVDCVYRIGGMPIWNLMVQITFDKPSQVGQIVMRQIKPLPGVQETRTTLVHETFRKGG